MQFASTNGSLRKWLLCDYSQTPVTVDLYGRREPLDCSMKLVVTQECFEPRCQLFIFLSRTTDIIFFIQLVRSLKLVTVHDLKRGSLILWA